MGYLYRPKLKSGERSSIWWCKYYVNGKPLRESTGVTGDTKTAPEGARRFLKEREGRVATGQPVLPRADRIRYDEIAADLRQHYEATASRDLEEADYRLQHLKTFFAGRRVASIGQAEATTYVLKRQGEGAAARSGFFEREQYEAVRRHLPADLQVAAAIAYAYGWRMQSEVLALERRQLDLEGGHAAPGPRLVEERRGARCLPDARPQDTPDCPTRAHRSASEARRANHPVSLPVPHRPSAPRQTP